MYPASNEEEDHLVVDPLSGMSYKESVDSHLMMSDADHERRQRKLENDALLTELEDAHRRMRILKIKKLVTESYNKKRGVRSILFRIKERFGLCRDDTKHKEQEPSTPSTQPPSTQQMDEYSVVAVCDTGDIGDECLQLDFISKGTPESAVRKYFASPAMSDMTCDLTEASSSSVEV